MSTISQVSAVEGCPLSRVSLYILIMLTCMKCIDYKNGSFIFMYSLNHNDIGHTGAQALAEGLQYCANMKELKYLLGDMYAVYI